MKVVVATFLAFATVAFADGNLRATGQENKESDLAAIEPNALKHILDKKEAPPAAATDPSVPNKPVVDKNDRELAVDANALNNVLDKKEKEAAPVAATDPTVPDNPVVDKNDRELAVDANALNKLLGKQDTAAAIDPKALNNLIVDKNDRDLAIDANTLNELIKNSNRDLDDVADVTKTDAKKVPQKPAVITGDPHFTMFSGRKYDFHGGCDLVFLDNPDYNKGQGMRIHVRTKITTWWSYVETAVVQIGSDTLEVMGGNWANKKYWVNGKPGETEVIDSALMPFTIGGHKVRFRVRSENQFQFKIFLEDHQEIILRSVKDFMKVDIEHHSKKTFGTSKGLLGTYDGGHMLARDGVTVLDDATQFGLEWQVRDHEPMLFHSFAGTQYPEICALPTETQFQRRLGEQLISREAAAGACIRVEPEDLEDCISDVMATGDEAIAGAF